MDALTAIQQFISNCGFPIAAFLMMFWLNMKQNKSIDTLSDKITQLITHIQDTEKQQ